MDKAHILSLLKNSGLDVIGMDDAFVYFTDPNCLFTAFDKIFEYAWIACVLSVILMLLGWAMYYIRNGIKITAVFKNAYSLFLILMVFSIAKPIVNAVYGDNLFARGCEIKKVSLESVNELLEQRNKNLSEYERAINQESFSITDSGPTTTSIDYSDVED